MHSKKHPTLGAIQEVTKWNNRKSCEGKFEGSLGSQLCRLIITPARIQISAFCVCIHIAPFLLVFYTHACARVRAHTSLLYNGDCYLCISAYEFDIRRFVSECSVISDWYL